MNIIFGMLLIASGVLFALTASPIMIMVGVMGTDDPTGPGWVDVLVYGILGTAVVIPIALCIVGLVVIF